MAARSAVHATAAALVIRFVEIERSVGALDEALDTRFSARHVLGRGAQILDALLEQLERARQVELFAVELRGNFFQSCQALLEGRHFDPRREPLTLAGTTPSRTTSSNGM